ncbi:RNA polymerase sigma-70 factor [Algivirga pacifica]|uniref:RNA polymerase sigma-70 factor n=1 Tax=Algivirga pacifica TaxID=1162670 RepID=A0ABP9D2I3_9BACT
MNTEDHNIFQRLSDSDPKALEQLFQDYYEGLCQYAFSYMGDTENAEEIAQELFCQLWEKREQLQISTSIKAYLYGSVRNNCLHQLRKLKVRSNYQQEVLKVQTDTYFPQDILVELELSEKIQQCLNNLPEQRQKIFRMSRFEGKKYKEIAEELGLSIKTVEAQMGKALSTLRVDLAEYLPVCWLAWCLISEQ